MPQNLQSWKSLKIGLTLWAVSSHTAFAVEHATAAAREGGSTGLHVNAGFRPAEASPLDLTPRPATDVPAAASAFPTSQIRHIDLGLESAQDLGVKAAHLDLKAADDLGAPPGMAQDRALVTPQSPAQRIAQGILGLHRDGLPLLHLWRGQDGGVSLGLNRQGRPGLWLSKKLH